MPERWRLRDMDLDEISLVRSGDDPTAEVVIAKSAHPDNDKSADDGHSSSTLHDHEPPREDHDMGDEIKKDDLPAEVVEYIEALEGVVESLIEGGEDDSFEEEDGDLSKSGDEDGADFDLHDLAKSAPEVYAVIAKAQADADAAMKRAEAAEAIAKAEVDRREREEAIAKAAALPMINDNKEDLAEDLLALRKANPALADKMEALLSTANTQIAKSNIFTEFGKSGATTTIEKSVEAKVEELRKANPALTREQAEVMVYESDPSLYELTQEA